VRPLFPLKHTISLWCLLSADHLFIWSWVSSETFWGARVFKVKPIHVKRRGSLPLYGKMISHYLANCIHDQIRHVAFWNIALPQTCRSGMIVQSSAGNLVLEWKHCWAMTMCKNSIPCLFSKLCTTWDKRKHQGTMPCGLDALNDRVLWFPPLESWGAMQPLLPEL